MAMVRVSIPNWEKFNPRSDRANYTWFRFQNDFFHDQRVFALTDSQQVLLAFTMCEISKKNGEPVDLLLTYVSAIRKQSQKQILKDFQSLQEIGLLTVEFGDTKPSSRRHRDGKKPSSLPATNDTNDTNERDETDERTDEATLTPQKLFDIWNEHRGDLPKAQQLTDKRREKARCRIRERPQGAYWVSVVKALSESDFASGRKTGSNGDVWQATFNWLIENSDNHVKVAEGNYRNKKRDTPSLPSSSGDKISELERFRQAQREREVGI